MGRLMPGTTHSRGLPPSSGPIDDAIALSPAERNRIVAAFFDAHPGSGKATPGLGRAILDFQAWEIRSERIGAQAGSPWWRAVNGAMVLDMAAVLDATCVSATAHAWQCYASERGRTQAALWEAHQQSLHRAIDACAALLRNEPAPEQAFAAVVVDVVDRTALADRPTDSDELATLVERFYPAEYPIDEADIPPLERMRARTADALRGADGGMFADVGLWSGRWNRS